MNKVQFHRPPPTNLLKHPSNQICQSDQGGQPHDKLSTNLLWSPYNQLNVHYVDAVTEIHSSGWKKMESPQSIQKIERQHYYNRIKPPIRASELTIMVNIAWWNGEPFQLGFIGGVSRKHSKSCFLLFIKNYSHLSLGHALQQTMGTNID